MNELYTHDCQLENEIESKFKNNYSQKIKKNLLIRDNFYTRPYFKYFKYQKKLNSYLQLYDENKNKYYFEIFSNDLSKFLRKKFLIFFLTSGVYCLAYYLIKYFGLQTIIFNYIEKMYDNIALLLNKILK